MANRLGVALRTLGLASLLAGTEIEEVGGSVDDRSTTGTSSSIEEGENS